MSTKSKRIESQPLDLMRNAMEKHRLSITDMADRIGISRSYASQVYHGKRSPSPKLLRALERLVRMPSICDLEDDDVTGRVNEKKTDSVAGPSEYLKMSEVEIEKAIVDYAKNLPKERGVKRVVTLTVLRDLAGVLLKKTGA